MSRFAVLLYPSASLQEITCLTAALSVWYGESIDYIAGEDKEYRSEEGLRLLPTKTAAEARRCMTRRWSPFCAGASERTPCLPRSLRRRCCFAGRGC